MHVGVSVIPDLKIARGQIANLLARQVQRRFPCQLALADPCQVNERVKKDFPFSQRDGGEETVEDLWQGGQSRHIGAFGGTGGSVYGLHSQHVGHVANEVIRRESMVIEKRSIDEEDGRYLKLAAEWRRPLRHRSVVIVKGHQNRSRWKASAIRVSQDILQAHGTVVASKELQRRLKMPGGDAHAQVFGKWRVGSRDVMKDDAPQPIRRTQNARHAETSGQPEGSLCTVKNSMLRRPRRSFTHFQVLSMKRRRRNC